MYRHAYSPTTVERTSDAKIIGIDKSFTNDDKVLQDTIPGGGLIVYTTTTD